jgi:hypothetical protein
VVKDPDLTIMFQQVKWPRGPRVFLMFYAIVGWYHAFCGPVDSIAIKLSIQKDTVARLEDMKITLVLQSERHECFLLPDQESWGFPHSIEGFYWIEMQEKLGDHYVDIDFQGHIDNIPTLSMDTVCYHHHRELPYPVYTLFPFSPGEYRIRVLCRFSMYNNLKDKYTDWVYLVYKSDDRKN